MCMSVCVCTSVPRWALPDIGAIMIPSNAIRWHPSWLKTPWCLLISFRVMRLRLLALPWLLFSYLPYSNHTRFVAVFWMHLARALLSGLSTCYFLCLEHSLPRYSLPDLKQWILLWNTSYFNLVFPFSVCFAPENCDFLTQCYSV